MSKAEFSEKTVFITGAGSGIGYQVALAFAEKGAKIIATDIHQSGLEELAAEPQIQSERFSAHILDVTDEAAYKNLAKQLEEAGNIPDIVVNNAGVGFIRSFEDTSTEDWQLTLKLNVMGVVFGCQNFVDIWLRRDIAGHLVNLSSMAAYTPIPNASAYVASKYAVEGLSEVLGLELVGTGISVSCVHPGVINTPIVQNDAAFSLPEEQRKRLQKHYVEKGAHPRTVADDIVKGVERNSATILSGKGTMAVNLLRRILPRKWYRNVIISQGRQIGYVSDDHKGPTLGSRLMNPKVLAASGAVLLAFILTPNGFFSGHHTAILTPETAISLPTPHIAGDIEVQNAAFVGTVTTATGLPISGAMVTAFSTDEARRVTVYTNQNGDYDLKVPFAGQLALRIRTPYFEDISKDATVSDGQTLEVDFSTQRLSDPDDLSDSLTASAHAARLSWPEEADRATFVSQCNFCHQVGNEMTRAPRDKEQWEAVVERMDGYLTLLTSSDKETIIDSLNETFTGEAIEAIQTWDVSPELAQARIEEWMSGDGLSFIHDADVGHDGRLYGADEGHDVIWELNRETGQIDQVDLPDVDLPVGGYFSGLALPVGVFSGKHGPHSMAEGTDGRLWITNSLSSRLMAYTAETNTFDSFDIGADSLYPHTIREDLEERLWFTLALSNQVARFDPQTNQLDLLDLPANSIGSWFTDALMPSMAYFGSFFPQQNLPFKMSHHKWANLGRSVVDMPYGIDINPKDGSVWYVKLNANKLGRIDADTFELTEIDTPTVGPRRPRFAPNGILWIPGFDTGDLLSFDPVLGTFNRYPLPTLSPNEYETPYALNVHPETGVVWITSNMSDRIFAFDPKTEEFISYPLPTRSSFLRDLVFTDDGKICSSHSNLPSYAIEGGLGGFICLDPDKD